MAYASCALNERQQRYFHLDREALGLIFAVTHFHKFLIGRKFTLVTDNSPIRHIFSPAKDIPIYTRDRLQRYACILQTCHYVLVHRKSEEVAPADALSRLTCEAKIHEIYCDEVFEELPVSEDVAAETKKDPLLNKVMKYVHIGWSAKVEHPDLQYFQKLNMQLSTDKGCLMFNNAVIIPSSLRPKVLKILHLAHPGIVRTKALARNKIWWPDLSKVIEVFRKNCPACITVNVSSLATAKVSF